METNRLVIGKDNIQDLTFSQTYNKYINLIKKTAWKYTRVFEYDDAFQLASLALWKAFDRYDIERTQAAFGYYANIILNRCMNRCASKYLTKNFINSISLNETIDGQEKEYITKFADKDNYSELLLNLSIEETYPKLNEKEKKIVEMYTIGDTQAEIANKLCTNQSKVSRTLKKVGKLLLN